MLEIPILGFLLRVYGVRYISLPMDFELLANFQFTITQF